MFKVFAVGGGFAINTFQDDLCKDEILFYEGLSDRQNASFVEGACTVIGNIYQNPDLLTK